jgi:nucleotidyltransferase/DNA polymerase involved in DNA repair
VPDDDFHQAHGFGVKRKMTVIQIREECGGGDLQWHYVHTAFIEYASAGPEIVNDEIHL